MTKSIQKVYYERVVFQQRRRGNEQGGYRVQDKILLCRYLYKILIFEFFAHFTIYFYMIFNFIFKKLI